MAALASALASNGVVPSVAVSWTVTQRVVERAPVGVQVGDVLADRMSASFWPAWNDDRAGCAVDDLQRLQPTALRQVGRVDGTNR